ncbi:MAG: Na(+)-translocating NADH-quinone reductase subunit F [Flavobacteriaceae bacterium TMED179]|nr:MAG: Na(+)-translocating NADH-quinone reductase subunit F [Flavobacteriaceae bacterium TMED179]|tara:strand:- start:1041 stop:1400 length:360 start_codon:yes stop_codon:yes gene_type:complete
METISLQELHHLAMEEVGTFLEEEGYEFLAINSEIKRSPQFVCVKDKLIYFVVVSACLYPVSPNVYDIKLINKVKLHAKKNNAKLYFAGVGFAHAEDYNIPLSKNNPYTINFNGLKEIL